MCGVASVDHRGVRDLRGGAVAGAVLQMYVGASAVLSHGGDAVAGAVLQPYVGASTVPSPGGDVFPAGGGKLPTKAIPGCRTQVIQHNQPNQINSEEPKS